MKHEKVGSFKSYLVYFTTIELVIMAFTLVLKQKAQLQVPLSWISSIFLGQESSVLFTPSFYSLSSVEEKREGFVLFFGFYKAVPAQNFSNFVGSISTLEGQ